MTRARLAKIKQGQAASISKRAKPLGRKYSFVLVVLVALVVEYELTGVEQVTSVYRTPRWGGKADDRRYPSASFTQHCTILRYFVVVFFGRFAAWSLRDAICRGVYF